MREMTCAVAMTSIPASHTRPLDAASMALVVFLCLAWGFNQPAVKLAILEGVPPLIQCAIRSSLGIRHRARHHAAARPAGDWRATAR